MRNELRAVAFLLSIGVSTSVCADASWGITDIFTGWGHGVSGSGNVRSETREVGRFDAIDLRDSTDIEVRVGSAATLSIEADDNVLPLISTKVRGNTLVIESTGSYHTRHTPKVILTTPSLNRLNINGSGDARLSNLAGEALALSISGSGDIRADGDVKNVNISIDGSGDADLVALQSRSATVEINGSGNVNLSVTDALKAEVNGSGDISYRGSPERLSSRVNGSGEISRR